MRCSSLRISALILACATGGGAVAFAQLGPGAPGAGSHGAYGTSASPSFNARSVLARSALAPALASFSWTGANYGTGGAALRNRGTANVSVSGVTGAVKAAFIYWAVIDPNSLGQYISVQRQPTSCAGASCFISGTGSAAITLLGTQIGSGPQPCWTGSMIHVYRAAIPLNIANGNGSYQVTILNNAAGSTTGDDPWVAPPVLPLWEGASIVIVGTGTGTVNLFDSLAGTMFIPPFSYTLTLTAPTTAGVLFDNIGADGQTGAGRAANAGTSGETTTINGVAVAGPGSPYNDSDWNGSSGYPIPQLWDDTGHAFTPRPHRH